MFLLQVLGPVELRRAGQALPLRTHKALALLLLLAFEGPSPRARLSAWLWPALGESDARRNLRRELARLRQAGAADAVVAAGDTLALAVGVMLDAALCDSELAAGQPDAALARWHGPPADGLQLEDAAAFDLWLSGLRERLTAQRRRALEASAAAREAGGDAEGALQRIHALLADDPLQEAHHRDAMRLHAQCGRREAALAQYAHCRDLLARELGVAPLAATEALAAALRGRLSKAAGSAAPAAPAAPGEADAPPARSAPAEAALPGSPAAPTAAAQPAAATAPRAPGAPVAWPLELPLVGREREFALLETAWAAGRTLLIEGEAGIGKTRLACDFAAAQGAYALAQCRPGDREVPYASFTRALRRLAGDTLAHAGLPAWVTAELARLLPELGPVSGPITSVEERRRFFEACAAAWQALSSGDFDAVVIDDWHLADAPSRALLGYIAQQRAEATSAATTELPAPPGAREIFVFRPQLDDDARAALLALAEGTQAAHVQLAVLDADQMLTLVRRLSGAPDPQRFTARLLRATGGNPYFVAEMLRHWRGLQLLSMGADGVWQTPFDDATADYLELPLPDSVRSAVLARVRRLPDAPRRLLEAAALAAEPFAPALLAGACGLSELETLAAIEDAMAAQLLREHDAGRGYAFAHDLVQLALDSALTPERRRLVHRRLALGAEASAAPAPEIARHWENGGQAQRAVVHRMAAADTALALYSDSDAERHWQAALDDQPTLAQQVRILGQRWTLLRNRDDRPGLQAAVAEFDALRLQALVDPAAAEVAVDAAIEAAHILSLTNQTADALQRIDACLAAPVAGVSRRARALMVRVQALNGQGRSDEAIAVAEAVLAAGGLAPQQHGQVLHALIYGYFLRSQPRPALACAQRSLALWQSVGSRRSVARAHANIGLLLGMLDEQAAACEALERAYGIAAELRIFELQREVANNLANQHLHLGAPARAIAVVRQAWDLSPHFSLLDKPVFFLGMLVQAHYQLGELGTALAHAEDAHARALALDDTRTLADCVSMALDVYSFIGDHTGAARLIASLQGRSLDGYKHFRVKLVFNLVVHALRTGDVAAARAHLATLGAVDALAQPPDQAQARLRHAQVALAEGDAAAALRWLEPLRDAPLHVEVWALSCALRLAAHAALGGSDDGDLARADAALRSGLLPALPALELRRERSHAARRAGDTGTAERLHGEISAEVARLAASLHERPQQQAQFRALWR